MSNKIFSGKRSVKFWDAVNKVPTPDGDLLYCYGCKAQTMERQNDELLARLEAVEELNTCYRLRKSPTEKLLCELSRTRNVLENAKENKDGKVQD